MSARLVSVGDRAAPAIVLQRPVLLIGRHPECDIRLDRPQVSRRHCCVALAYDRLSIRDLGSRNGVRVNGRLVQETLLQPGDEVAIAQLIYRLEEDAPNGSTPAPTPPARRPIPPPAEPSPPARSPEMPLDDGDDDGLVPLGDDDL